MVQQFSTNRADAADESAMPRAQGKSWIQKTLGVCGGDACIRNSRITVWGLVEWRRLGLSDAEIVKRVEGLTLADLEATWEYYEQNRNEIEQAIRENEDA